MTDRLPCDRCKRRFGDHQINVHRGTLLCDDCLDGPYAPPHEPPMFFHMTPTAPHCEHDFQGWREFEDGRGGERVCRKCGMGAMAHTLSLDI